MAEVFGDLHLLFPEVILVATLIAVIVADLFTTPASSRRVGLIALLGCAVALGFLVQPFAHVASLQTSPIETGLAETPARVLLFREMIVIDLMAVLFKVIFIASTMVTFLITMLYPPLRGKRQGEYYSLLLTALLGMCLLVSANDFIMFVLALETLSL